MAKQKSSQEPQREQQSTLTLSVPIADVPSNESSYALSYQGLKLGLIVPAELQQTWRSIVYGLRSSHATLPNGRHVDTGADAWRWILYQAQDRLGQENQ